MKITGLPKNWDELPRDEKIHHEEKRLEKLMKDVPKQQVALVARLIERAAFMLVMLVEYETILMEQGVITSMCQGQYDIDRENPAAKGYNTMIKNYQAVIKQLTELLPDKKDAAKDAAGDRLRQFMNGGGNV